MEVNLWFQLSVMVGAREDVPGCLLSSEKPCLDPALLCLYTCLSFSSIILNIRTEYIWCSGRERLVLGLCQVRVRVRVRPGQRPPLKKEAYRRVKEG